MKKADPSLQMSLLGLKATRPRALVFSVFKKTTSPLSAERIIKLLSESNVNDVTIYRTLSSFERAGLIRKVDLRKGSVFYELADHHHHHIVCQKCGLLEDFDECVGEEIIKLIEENSKKFKVINDHSFELFGICKACV